MCTRKKHSFGSQASLNIKKKQKTKKSTQLCATSKCKKLIFSTLVFSLVYKNK